jgi:hypothetical protein
MLVPKMDLTGSRDVLRQPDDSDVIVSINSAVVLVEGGVRAGDDDASGFGLFTEVQGTGVNLPGVVPVILHCDCLKFVQKWQ